MRKPKKNPQWTILSNYWDPSKTKWVGTCWEFYDDKEIAETRYKELKDNDMYCPTLRPFCYKVDNPHLGHAHFGRK